MELVERYLGKFGRYQAFVYGLLTLPFMITGAQVMAFTFTGAVPRARCFLPEQENAITATFDDPRNLSRYLSGKFIQRNKLLHCRFCTEEDLASSMNGSCELENSTSCHHGYVYSTEQHKWTIPMKLDMVCQEGAWKREFASSMWMLGIFIGNFTAGILGDKFGRRPVFLGYSFASIITYHLIIFVPNFPILCILHVLNGLLSFGAFTTAYVISMEFIGGIARTICGIFVQGWFAVGFLYTGLLAWLIRDYRYLQLAVSLPTLLLVPYYWLMPESVRWQIVEGKREEAKQTLKKAAKFNGVVINDDAMNALLTTDEQAEGATVLSLFRKWPLARTTLIVFYSWFACSMTYYGLSLNTSDLPGNEYVNFVLSALVEFPAYFVAIISMEKIGRKISMILSLGLGGICIIISAVLPKTYPMVIIIAACIGKSAVAGAFAIIYNYSVELIPTVARNAGLGVASALSRIASFSAPQIYLLGTYLVPWLPFLIYGSVAAVGAALCLMLPETLGKPLPETIEDGVQLSSFRKSPPSRPADEKRTEDTAL